MARVKALPGEPLDERCHTRERPQVGAKPVRGRPLEQGPFDPGQGPPIQPGLAPRPARGLQAPPTLLLPGVKPPVRRRHAHAQLPRHRVLRPAPGEQPGRFEPPRLQRREVPPSPCGDHPSAWHRTP